MSQVESQNLRPIRAALPESNLPPTECLPGGHGGRKGMKLLPGKSGTFRPEIVWKIQKNLYFKIIKKVL